MRLEIAAPITAALLVLGAGIAITSRRQVEASALWVAAFALVVLLSILFDHVRARRRAAQSRERRPEHAPDKPQTGPANRRVARKELSAWKS